MSTAPVVKPLNGVRVKVLLRPDMGPIYQKLLATPERHRARELASLAALGLGVGIRLEQLVDAVTGLRAGTMSPAPTAQAAPAPAGKAKHSPTDATSPAALAETPDPRPDRLARLRALPGAEDM